MKNRPDKNTYFLDIAKLVSSRSTCIRRDVGCVIVDKNYRILSTGHNGVPPGMPHCIDIPCSGSNCPSGTGLDLCQATHAEINALLFCRDIMQIEKIYLTVLPCLTCVKAILPTSCKEIIYSSAYSELHDDEVIKQLNHKNIKVTFRAI